MDSMESQIAKANAKIKDLQEKLSRAWGRILYGTDRFPVNGDKMSNIKLVFICGPYRAGTPWEKEQNIRRAEEKAHEVAVYGLFPVCPHSNTRPYFEGVQNDKFWLEGTKELLRRCDGVALVERWDRSDGALAEKNEAERLGIPIVMPSDTSQLKYMLA